MNRTLRNVLLLEGESANRSEDAHLTGDPDRRAPVINRQVHAEAGPDKEARTKSHEERASSLINYIYICICDYLHLYSRMFSCTYKCLYEIEI